MRLERGLTEIEERIQKFVDTSENESRQKCEIFDQISNKEIVSIITFRNRHRLGPAPGVLHGKGPRCSGCNLRSPGARRSENEGLQEPGPIQRNLAGLLSFLLFYGSLFLRSASSAYGARGALFFRFVFSRVFRVFLRDLTRALCRACRD